MDFKLSKVSSAYGHHEKKQNLHLYYFVLLPFNIIIFIIEEKR